MLFLGKRFAYKQAVLLIYKRAFNPKKYIKENLYLAPEGAGYIAFTAAAGLVAIANPVGQKYGKRPGSKIFTT